MLQLAFRRNHLHRPAPLRLLGSISREISDLANIIPNLDSRSRTLLVTFGNFKLLAIRLG